jgi:hypothetical protein
VFLATLSLIFLGIALRVSNNVVFQIDSVLALVAAIIVLLRGHGSSVQIRVVDRMLSSYEKLISGFSRGALRTATFTYRPMGDDIVDVIVAVEPPEQNRTSARAQSNGTISESSQESITKSDTSPDPVIPSTLTPPGADLAELFLREMGVSNPSLESLIQSLNSVACGRLELAESVEAKRTGDAIEIVIEHPAITSSVSDLDLKRGMDGNYFTWLGLLGSPMASLFAVLFCESLKQDVRIKKSTYSEMDEVARISLEILPQDSKATEK